MVKINTRFLFIPLKSMKINLLIALFLIFSGLSSFALTSGQSSPTLNGTVQSNNMSGASGNISGASGNISGASGNISGASGNISGASGNISGASGNMTAASGNMT